jgi:hypothetical protein
VLANFDISAATPPTLRRRLSELKPGPPGPFDKYPRIALAIVVVALPWGASIHRRDSAFGERVGSILADAG